MGLQTDDDSRATPFLLAVGGFDSSGGAGVVRDFLTGRTLGARVRMIPTAWTEQSPDGVHSIEPRAAEAVEAAIRESLAAVRSLPSVSLGTCAVKIGMLPDGRVARVVMDALADFTGPVVMDPVLSASSGGALYRGELADLFALGARCTLVTPNAAEAAAFTGLPVRDPTEAVAAAQALHEKGWPSVLVKGGHLSGDVATDVLVSRGRTHLFESTRIAGASPRGTGCALATAIGLGLARGADLQTAVAVAKAWLGNVILEAVDRHGERHLS